MLSNKVVSLMKGARTSRGAVAAAVAAVLAVAAFGAFTQTAGAFPWSTQTTITGKAICSERYTAFWGITYIRDNGCSTVRLRTDNGGYDRTVAAAKRGLLPYGGFSFSGVPVNTWATLWYGANANGYTCSRRVWISKPGLIESLSIGDVYCR